MKADAILLIVMLVAVVGNIALSISRIRHVHGARRFLAGLPLMGMLLATAKILSDLAHDPASHNLWPFEILLISAAGLIYSMGCLGLESSDPPWQRPKFRN